MLKTTFVGKYKVAVRRHHFCTLVTFASGEHGKQERGDFCFWTAVLKEPVKVDRRIRRKIWGRSHVSLPAGDRFDRMKVERKGKRAAAFYESAWSKMLKAGANIKYIRPSTAAELRKWLKTHDSDALYAIRVSIGGREQTWLSGVTCVANSSTTIR